MRITILPLTIILSAVLFLSGCNLVYAKGSEVASESVSLQKTIEDEIGYSIIHPASFLYFLKMAREDIELKMAQSSSVKAVRFLEFATRRIREVKALSRAEKEDLIEPALERYWTHLQDLLGNFNSLDLRRNSEIEWQVYQHLYILNNLYPSITNNRARIGIRRTIYRISTWQTKFGQILAENKQADTAVRVYEHRKMACNFLSKEASSPDLNEVEKGVFLERAKKCVQSLQTDI